MIAIDAEHAEGLARRSSPCGCRNALTPFAIASTPVSAVEPDANARSTTKSVTAPVPAGERMRRDRAAGRLTVALRRGRRRRATSIAVDEAVRREREEEARLAHAAQVDERDQHEASERQPDLVRCQRRSDDVIAKNARRDGDGDGEHVVDEQRRRRDEARQRAEVLARDDVRAAARSRRRGRSAGTRGSRSPAAARSRSRSGSARCSAARPAPRRARPSPPRSRTRPTRAGRRRRSAARADFGSSSSSIWPIASAGRRTGAARDAAARPAARRRQLRARSPRQRY